MAAFLPPGVVFIPSDLVLVGYYLANKNNEDLNDFNGSYMIKEINFNEFEPFELPHASSFEFNNQRHWYYFISKIDEERRHCKTGFWKKKGNDCEITNGVNTILGIKSLFAFYLEKSPNDEERTNWTMYEYTLAYTLADKPQAPFVVCRVFECPPEMDADYSSGLYLILMKVMFRKMIFYL